MNSPIDVLIGQSVQALQNGQLENANATLDRVLKAYPTHTPALYVMGLIKASLGHHLEAAQYFKKVLKANGSDPGVLYNLAQALSSGGRLPEALPYIEKATKIDRTNWVVWLSYGRCLLGLSRIAEATSALENALKLSPNNPQILVTKGSALNAVENYDLALDCLKVASNLDPSNFLCWLELGLAYSGLRQFPEAITAVEKALEINPHDERAWKNIGLYFLYSKRFSEAFAAFERALELYPLDEDLLAAKAHVLRELKLLGKSLEVSEKAIELNSKHPNAWFNKGITLLLMERYREAVASLGLAIQYGAKHDYLLGALTLAKKRIADWKGISTLLEQIKNEINQNKKVVRSFHLMSLLDDPLLHLKAARIEVESLPNIPSLSPTISDNQDKRVRIGYFSADFYDHPVGKIITEMIELHNRDQFEVHGFSLAGASEEDQVRPRLRGLFDHFYDLENFSDQEVAQKARDCNLDIAIDLSGYTNDNRATIFANRAAPVQVNFLGYPGTMGREFIDYIVADEVIIPKENQAFFAEKVAYLPNSYLMYDTTQKISCEPLNRKQLGLPVASFVFCGFNNGYKISSEVIDSWSKILAKVEGSVLWLTQGNEDFNKNIWREFADRNIPPDRIIFAGRVDSPNEHLARLKFADLFLDAWPYNAHSTAMDFSYAGVPLITKIGQSFAARVGASLLTSLELPSLITSSPEAYETLAISLAKDSARLSEIRSHLANDAIREKLFNIKKYTEALENLYQQMYDRNQGHLPAEHLYAIKSA
ncbi:tetratricopeptide repeat protein [Polynucleobacter paneuropaeus]|nr:tetratricopeptide repeat protein [Polynucleobacter paneuropaeus]